MPARGKIFKACRRCRALVNRDTEICPICGSREFSDEWEGVVIIIDPERSELAKVLNIDKPGRYALKVT